MAERTWHAARKLGRPGHTVVLKLKTADFRILTRSLTLPLPPDSDDTLAERALGLRARVDLPPATRYRLVGVGLSGFEQEAPADAPAQAGLFSEPAEP